MRPHCPTSRVKRSALARCLFPRLAAAVLFGFLIGGAPAEADERVNFANASQGDPIQGYLKPAEGRGSISGRRSSAHLSRPAG